jgi:hypothetical protein
MTNRCDAAQSLRMEGIFVFILLLGLTFWDGINRELNVYEITHLSRNASARVNSDSESSLVPNPKIHVLNGEIAHMQPKNGETNTNEIKWNDSKRVLITSRLITCFSLTCWHIDPSLFPNLLNVLVRECADGVACSDSLSNSQENQFLTNWFRTDVSLDLLCFSDENLGKNYDNFRNKDIGSQSLKWSIFQFGYLIQIGIDTWEFIDRSKRDAGVNIEGNRNTQRINDRSGIPQGQ